MATADIANCKLLAFFFFPFRIVGMTVSMNNIAYNCVSHVTILSRETYFDTSHSLPIVACMLVSQIVFPTYKCRSSVIPDKILAAPR